MPDKDLRNILENPSHHAYLILGDTASNFEKLRLILREKIMVGAILAADVSSHHYETLNIDDARNIKETQNTMPIGERKVILLAIGAIQQEAQNSLLKLFEEPSHTLFIICARHASLFLPTLLSRFHIVQSNVPKKIDNKKPGGISIPDFLSSNIRDRLSLLEPIIKEKDKILAEFFLNDLESTLHKNLSASENKNQNSTAVFEDIFAARRFLRSRSPSVKMILEHVSGIIPQVPKV